LQKQKAQKIVQLATQFMRALGYQIFRENGDNNEENINHGNHVI
jgi:hypothetical protein